MLSYEFAYILGDFVIGLIWLWLFLQRKDLKHEILISSLFFGFCGPISQLLYLRDYWKPELMFGFRIGMEDFLFGFFIGGIATVIFKEIFGRYYAKHRDRTHHWMWFVPISVLIAFLVLGFLISLGMNSIYASIFLFGVIFLFIILYRGDLFFEAIGSGIIMSVIMILFYSVYLVFYPEIFQRWWFLHNLSGRFLFGIPIEEFWWAFAFGLMAGPYYDFVTGRKFKN